MQEILDRSLLQHDGIAILDRSSCRIVITKNMEEVVLQNFQVLMDLEEVLISFSNQSLDEGLVSQRLLVHLDNVLKMVRSWSFHTLCFLLILHFPKRCYSLL